MQKNKILASILMIILSVLIINANVLLADSADNDSITSTFEVDATITVTDVDFQTDGYVTLSDLDPDASTYYRLNFTVATAGTLADLVNCTIYIFDDSEHGADYDEASPDGLQLVQFLYVESTDTWTVNDQGALSNWDVDSVTSDDSGTDSVEVSVEFSMRFISSEVARYDTDWNATVLVYDSTDDIGSSAETGLITFNQYFYCNIVDTTIDFGAGIEPSSVNNTASGVVVQIIANCQWEVKMSAVDFSSGGESDVDIEANNIICWDTDNSAGGISAWVRNTDVVLLDTWDDQVALSTETAIERTFYILLSPAELFVVAVEWETTITITVQANT